MMLKAKGHVFFSPIPSPPRRINLPALSAGIVAGWSFQDVRAG